MKRAGMRKVTTSGQYQIGECSVWSFESDRHVFVECSVWSFGSDRHALAKLCERIS